MALTIICNANGELIFKGDEYLAIKLPEGFNVSEIDVSDVRINADAVARAYNDAEAKGIEAIKRYFAIKEKFIAMVADQTPDYRRTLDDSDGSIPNPIDA